MGLDGCDPDSRWQVCPWHGPPGARPLGFASQAGCNGAGPHGRIHAQGVSGDGWVRLADLPDADLPGDVKIGLVAVAIEELAIVEALRMVHGEDRGVIMYLERGGCVYPDLERDGDPMILVYAHTRAG